MARFCETTAWIAHYKENLELELTSAGTFMLVLYTNECIELGSRKLTADVETIISYLRQADLTEQVIPHLLDGRAIGRPMNDSTFTDIPDDFKTGCFVLWFTTALIAEESEALIRNSAIDRYGGLYTKTVWHQI